MASHLELNFTEQFFRRILYIIEPMLATSVIHPDLRRKHHETPLL
jgi:hypothetical protein